ncbi:DUF4270 domain-containing protein [Aquimarina algicola]|nr:DUF4270 domain-containing protein [Aquimarina algicola]
MAIKTITVFVIVFAFFACDDDFNSVGSEVIGDVNFEENTYSAVPVAYSKRFNRVRTNSLIREVNGTQLVPHANLLGIYNDPVYGKSTYSILSQVVPTPSRFPLTFGANPVLDSVVISLPYFSTITESPTANNPATIYGLDSVYGGQPFRLSIFQSDFFLRDFDPTSNDGQVYYSNDISSNFPEDQIENSSNLLRTIESFVPSPGERALDEFDVNNNDSLIETTRETPRLRVVFSKNRPEDQLIVERFKKQFLDKVGNIVLSNTNNFINYYRGIYFKAEDISGGGNLLYVNMADARMTLYYNSETSSTTDGDARQTGELELLFSNAIINGMNTEFNSDIATALLPENQDKVNGEESLYLKGGDGSFAVIDLFSGQITNENGEQENELDFLRRQNWLINEANLRLYVDQEKMTSGGSTEPERIYVFDLETGAVLADYALDITLFGLQNFDAPLFSIPSHLGRLSRQSDGRGEFYNIRLTQHVINLLNGDTDNIKIGVAVSQNVNSTTLAIGDTPEKEREVIPTSSIVSHEGTILYGNGNDVPESKRLQLEILYTSEKDN